MSFNNTQHDYLMFHSFTFSIFKTDINNTPPVKPDEAVLLLDDLYSPAFNSFCLCPERQRRRKSFWWTVSFYRCDLFLVSTNVLVAVDHPLSPWWLCVRWQSEVVMSRHWWWVLNSCLKKQTHANTQMHKINLQQITFIQDDLLY